MVKLLNHHGQQTSCRYQKISETLVDGNSFFKSVIDQLNFQKRNPEQLNHSTLRKKVFEFVEQKLKESPMSEEMRILVSNFMLDETSNTFEECFANQKNDGTFPTTDFISFTPQYLQNGIFIHQIKEDGVREIYFPSEVGALVDTSLLRIAVLKNHFQSVVEIDIENQPTHRENNANQKWDSEKNDKGNAGSNPISPGDEDAKTTKVEFATCGEKSKNPAQAEQMKESEDYENTFTRAVAELSEKLNEAGIVQIIFYEPPLHKFVLFLFRVAWKKSISSNIFNFGELSL